MYLKFATVESAQKALEALDGRWFGGKQVMHQKKTLLHIRGLISLSGRSRLYLYQKPFTMPNSLFRFYSFYTSIIIIKKRQIQKVASWLLLVS